MPSEIGRIKSWNDEKGFGFITSKKGGKTVFFHINNFSRRHKRPMQGLSVIYTLSKDSRGRLFANNVYPEKGHKKPEAADKQKVFSILISIVFFAVVAGLVVLNKLPAIVLGFYVAASALTFGLYAKDKLAAKSGRWRTSESTLHLLSLAGGWPGAAIAQSRLRHKSKKASFRVIYWFTVIINCVILAWLLTPEGSHKLDMTLRNLEIM